MEQYIPKAAVVAEIERRVKSLNKDRDFNYLQIKELEALLSSMDTLEVKEVDLKEEIDKIWKPRFSLGWDDRSLLSVSYKGFESIAKHFFELGLSVSNKA